jgi:putative ABC transport system substrate-binding protein
MIGGGTWEGATMPSMRRREFVSLLGGAAAAWPPAARAQQAERMQRIGVLMNLAADDVEAQGRVAAFQQALQQLGWTDGRNVRIDYRWGAGDTGRFRKYAEELLALAPDVVLASATPSVLGIVSGLARHSVLLVDARVRRAHADLAAA